MEIIDVEKLQWIPDPIHRERAPEKILHKDAKTHAYSRLIKTSIGFSGEKMLVHDFDEFVYIIRGGMINKRNGNVYPIHSIGYFSLGMGHGPFETPVGDINLEFRYYKHGGGASGKLDSHAMEFRSIDSLNWEGDKFYGINAEVKSLHIDEDAGVYVRLVRTNPGFVMKGGTSPDCDRLIYIFEGGMIDTETKEVCQADMAIYIEEGDHKCHLITPVGALFWEVGHYK